NDRSEPDRVLQECFVIAPDEPIGEMGVGELQLERRHQIDVETQTQGRAVVGTPTGLREEVVVRLLERAALVTRVRSVAAGAVAQLHEPGITVMRPGTTREVMVAEDMKLGNVLPAVGVVGGRSEEHTSEIQYLRQ